MDGQEMPPRVVEEEDLDLIRLMDNFNHVGMRADKYLVHSATEDGYKDVEHYTLTCPECGSDGRYDERGDVICEDPECAVVIAGDDGSFALPVENDNSRGFSGTSYYDKYGKLELSEQTTRGSMDPLI